MDLGLRQTKHWSALSVKIFISISNSIISQTLFDVGIEGLPSGHNTRVKYLVNSHSTNGRTVHFSVLVESVKISIVRLSRKKKEESHEFSFLVCDCTAVVWQGGQKEEERLEKWKLMESISLR